MRHLNTMLRVLAADVALLLLVACAVRHCGG